MRPALENLARFQHADLVDDRIAWAHGFSALEFLARWLDYVPEHCEVRVRGLSRPPPRGLQRRGAALF